jgi:hypothetical protein
MKSNLKRYKLQRKHRRSESSCTGLTEVPCLTLSGNWLKDAGFTYGREIEIEVESDRLVIKAV